MSHAQIDLYELQQTLSREEIMLCFNGSLSQTIIEELGLAIRKHLENERVEKSRVFDVFSIYIEQVQNIRHYAARRAGSETESQRLANAIVVVRQSGDRYIISSGNAVAHGDTGSLLAHIDHLRTLDASALRRLYKETLRKPRDKDPQAGAGLGLISMARLAKEPLSYALRPVDSVYAFFTLSATI
ncbi:SiaB family protein kinase [Desulfobotulus sp.]|jgi:hypothetical protein|uniref:SiaB family protein kinase n=1 Tax=Desulfobotulus sp. TaxID=1940337 RepID=UPI002A36C4F0|nr:SiaB family protein kinase [Desulfobotulus sp.]MDY0162432.1 SiaB family protein kinase [Desulfobotulus sp.]